MLQLNHRTVGSQNSHKGGQSVISTKEKIKKEAFSLFAQKGYYGTSIRDITGAVGITKSSLYSHYPGKDELFLAVFEDVVHELGKLFGRLLDDSKDMEIHDRLRYIFKEYILYFCRRPEIQRFTNMSFFHVPPELFDKIRSNYLTWEKPYRKRLEDIFAEGMQQEIIRKGNPEAKGWSFKTKLDGVIGWLSTSTDLPKDYIEDFWNDFWFGMIKKKEK